MNNQQFFEKGLIKWPGLLVKGNPVTKEQAMEILIRTDGFWFSSNEREFVSLLSKAVFGIESHGWDLTDKIKQKLELNFNDAWKWKDEQLKKYKLLDLSYLNNNRIASCWVGGVHGWCDWDGNIYTSNYNIGKWPTIEEVYNDWEKIASAFPFLELKAQLLDGEIYIENETRKPVVEFTVSNGKVTMSEASDLIVQPTELDFDNRSEIGCTIEKFVESIKFVENKMKSA